jgi:hypothetical protein
MNKPKGQPITWTISSANKPNPVLLGQFLAAVLKWSRRQNDLDATKEEKVTA